MNIVPEFVKLVNVQLDVELNTNISATELNDLVVNKDFITEKVTSLFTQLETESPNFILFPECSFFEELNALFIAKSNALNCVIISGSYINSEFKPELRIFMPHSPIEYVQKSCLSPFEYKDFANITIVPGSEPKTFTIKLRDNIELSFLVLICYDFYENHNDFFEEPINLLFIPSLNKKNERFYSQINQFCFKNPSFVLYSNATGQDSGHSAIFGFHEDYIQARNKLNGNICNNAELINETLIANLTNIENACIIAEVDINRPYIIKPNGISGNNIPNVQNVRKFTL